MKLSVILSASAVITAGAQSLRHARNLARSHHGHGSPELWRPNYLDDSSSSKSGKSSSSKSGKSGESSSKSSKGSSGKSGKSSSKSSKGSSGKSDKSSSESSSKSSKVFSENDYVLHGPYPPPPYSLGKSGKGSEGGAHYVWHSKSDDDDVSRGDDDHDNSSADFWEDDRNDDYPTDVCFSQRKEVACGGKPKGDAVYVEFSYIMETIGVDPEDVLSSVEGAILVGVADDMSSLGTAYNDVTQVSSSPKDHIKDEEMCTKKSGYECTVVKGEMTFYADGRLMDASDYSKIVEASMNAVDFSDIDGVKNVEYLDSGSSSAGFSKVISGEAVVVDDGPSTGAMIAVAMLAAFVVAAALLLARKLRRKTDTSDREFDLLSVDTNFEGKRFESTDPFTSTVDVHRCTSMYCNCNKGGTGTTFLPAPKKVNLDKVVKKQGLQTMLHQDVDETNAQDFSAGDDESLAADSMDTDTSSQYQHSSELKDEIIRADPPSEDRILAPVHEIAHDSEIDTECESDGEQDLDSIPPPPPLPTGKQLRNNSLQADEMSV